jgi:chitinase
MEPGCKYTGGGAAGACTNVAGVLSGYEIREKIAQGATVTLNEQAAAKVVTWGGNQWVSYDDAETLAMKVNYAHERCLGG